MRRFRAFILAAATTAIGCGRPGVDRRVVPSGVSLELPAGAPVPFAAVPRLAEMGIRSFFVPAARGRPSGNGVIFERLPPFTVPPGSRVYLEVVGSGDAAAALERDAGGAAAALWAALAPAVESGGSGVAGVHVTWPAGTPSKAKADLLRSLRSRIPPRLTISVAIASRLSEEERKSWRAIARSADFIVVETFGRGEGLDPAGVPFTGTLEDAGALGVPLIAAYAPQAWGVRRTADGTPSGTLPDSAVDALSEDRRYDFSFGDLLTDTDEDVYVFSLRKAAGGPSASDGGAAAGSVTFRERRVVDFTRSLAQARAAAGKLVRLASLEDDGRLIGLGVLEDVLLGRRLEPKLTFRASPQGNGVVFVAANESPESSALSRLNNWVDLRVEGARIVEVKPGDFDRYLFLDERGRPVLAFRASTVRFFENFVAPSEAMTTGLVRLSGPARLFASARMTLADGSVVRVPESRVPDSTASAKASAGGGERGPGGKGQAVEGEPQR